jgi:hypothetical protein
MERKPLKLLVGAAHMAYHWVSNERILERTGEERRRWSLSVRSATNRKGNAPAKSIAAFASRNRMSASASMGSIIAPTAARPAMYGCPTPMSAADPSRVELLVPNDDRLIPVIDPVVGFAAERAGLSCEEAEDLTRAAFNAVHEAFSVAGRNGNSNPVLRVLVSDFPNRVEVSVEQSGVAAGVRGARTTIVKEHAAPKTPTKL